jgi:hypothetical protein
VIVQNIRTNVQKQSPRDSWVRGSQKQFRGFRLPTPFHVHSVIEQGLACPLDVMVPLVQGVR